MTVEPRFTANGKQVLRKGEHYADAINEEAAGEIVEALNTLDWFNEP
jgi:hypothetical protein